MNWTTELDEQLSWQWTNILRPRWNGLTDEEYLWEPVPGMWSVRPPRQGRGRRGRRRRPHHRFRVPRHLSRRRSPPSRGGSVTCWSASSARGWPATSGGPPVDYDSYEYPATAADALDRLDGLYVDWIAGVRTLDDAALAAPLRGGRLRAGTDGRSGAAHQPRGVPPWWRRSPCCETCTPGSGESRSAARWNQLTAGAPGAPRRVAVAGGRAGTCRSARASRQPPESLLGALFAQAVQRTYLRPGGPGRSRRHHRLSFKFLESFSMPTDGVQSAQRIFDRHHCLDGAIKSFAVYRIRHAQSVTCHSRLSTLCCPLGQSIIDRGVNNMLTVANDRRQGRRAIGRRAPVAKKKKKDKKGKKKKK